MGWDRRKPWTAPAKTLVLYRSDTGWRFAIYNEAGVLNGHVGDLPPDTSAEDAQDDLLNKVKEDTGLEYVAAWSSDKPGWWSTELTVVSKPSL